MVLSVLNSELSLTESFILDEAERKEFLLIFAQNSPLYLNEDTLRCVSLIQGQIIKSSISQLYAPFKFSQ